MSPQLVRKPQNTYHHGDLREALVQAALREAEQGGPEAISIKALAKKLGVSQPAPYRHFADREALLQAVTAEAFRQFYSILREAITGPSKRSKLSRFAQSALDFGLRRNGIYRLMFASRIMACAAKDSELHVAARQTFGLLVDALEAPAVGLLRERHALKIWVALHGVVMLAEQGLLTGQAANTTREELVEDIVAQTKTALSAAIEAAGAADGRHLPLSSS
jgi:AcrR family transcriptional regulator